jgi:hypothetical protein
MSLRVDMSGLDEGTARALVVSENAMAELRAWGGLENAINELVVLGNAIVDLRTWEAGDAQSSGGQCHCG